MADAPIAYGSAFVQACMSKRNASSPWSNKATPKRYNPPPKPVAAVVQMPIIVPHDLMKYVIGRDGVVFKAITRRCKDVEYIWYDERRSIIELWAPKGGAFADAVELVNDRMLTIMFDKMDTASIGRWSEVVEDA